ATGRDHAFGAADEGHARVEAHVVLDVAADRGQRFDGGAVDAGTRTHLGGAEHFRPACDADDGVAVERGHVTGQRGVDGVVLVQREVDVVLGAGAGTGLGDGDLVRTTHAQAARTVTTARIGGGAADRARLDVTDDDFSAGNRLAAVVGHQAADAGRGALRE